MQEKILYGTIFFLLSLLIYSISSNLQDTYVSSDLIQPYQRFLIVRDYMKSREEPLSSFKIDGIDNPRLLIPVVIYGPNNQYQGFRESIMIAKILNRKVIILAFYKSKFNIQIAIPPFFKHYTSKGSHQIPPHEVFDMSSIYSLSQVAERIEISTSCPGKKTT